MKWKIVFLSACLVMAAGGGAAKGDKKLPPKKVKTRYRMPAIMFVTHVDWPKEAKHRETMAKFVAGTGINCVEAEMDLLDVCRKYKLYVRLGGDINVMLKAAGRLKDDPAVFAYFISDRRRAGSFPLFAKIARAYEKADPNHPTMFINRANWNEFTRFTDQVKPMMLDYYHYHWNHRRHPERNTIYQAMFRDLGLKNGIPVMRCVAADVSAGQIRQTIYTGLAYGQQGFHFWPPWHIGYKKDAKGKPVLNEQGEITPTITPWGKTIAAIATDMKILGPILLGSKSVAIYQTDPLPIAGQKAPAESWFQPVSKQLVVGHFRGVKKTDYLLVVNRDAGKKQEAKLGFKPSVKLIEIVDKRTGKWKPAELKSGGKQRTVRISIEPGDGQMLRRVGDNG